MTTPKDLNLDAFCNKAEAFEEADNARLSPRSADTIGDLIASRYGRRDVLMGALGVTAITALFGPAALASAPRQADASTSNGSFSFTETAAGVDETHHVAPGYKTHILLRWGDPITADAPDFDPANQTVEAQLKQFGYNNDYVGFVPLNDDGTRGLLCVNHEYTNEEVMFPGLGRQDRDGFAKMTRQIVDIEMAAHGGSIVEIQKLDGSWNVVRTGSMNRRITASTTAFTFDGPAAGADRMKTSADPDGMTVIGTLNNCAGGITPWGTYLLAEENFHGYFWTDRLDADGKPVLEGAHAASMKRYGVPARWYNWGRYHDRFNVDLEPNEPNRFGWIVEVDPADPDATPVKHTALGRFRHEGAESIVNKDGRVVLYSGDDARFDYVYKYVSNGTFDPEASKAQNRQLLSNGTLYVGQFHADGTLDWLPLVHGQGPLTAENGFASQADILIDARLAADALGATPMDRPEDVQPGQGGKVFMMLTNNTRRKPGQEDAANPRADNAFGHIIEMLAPDEDHAAPQFTWSILVKCGDPNVADVGAEWHPDTSDDGWFASPDNCAIDSLGRLWISTDQGRRWGKTGKADGLYAVEHEGGLRGTITDVFPRAHRSGIVRPLFHRRCRNAVPRRAASGHGRNKGFSRL
jgi:secreted PhoX family phosphatase